MPGVGGVALRWFARSVLSIPSSSPNGWASGQPHNAGSQVRPAGDLCPSLSSGLCLAYRETGPKPIRYAVVSSSWADPQRQPVLHPYLRPGGTGPLCGGGGRKRPSRCKLARQWHRRTRQQDRYHSQTFAWPLPWGAGPRGSRASGHQDRSGHSTSWRPRRSPTARSMSPKVIGTWPGPSNPVG